MKKIIALCNAHLDPIWLWQKEEGIAEALSTFRVAADFCEQYDGFVFNHNESLLYEWVEQYEPALFERIRTLVAQGKWRIMGGWFLQPDCTMPSGESFLRQIETGNRYFREKFGIVPKTAINFDPFGHTRGLVQILKKCGYENYLFMRASDSVPEEDFIWRGFDGSEIVGHRIKRGYGNRKGEISNKINEILTCDGDWELMCWGIGDHGGGPSRVDWEEMQAYAAEHPEIFIIHGGCEEYFDTIDRSSLPVFSQGLTHCMVGCYTTMARVKQKHRKLENELLRCEKMLAASDLTCDPQRWEEAEKALLFSEFHDALPGTMIQKGEEEILQLLDHGLEILNKEMIRAFFRLCGGQPKAKAGEIPLLVFNPHPYPVRQIIEVEFQRETQNWNENETTMVSVRDASGNHLPTQNIKEECMLHLDWRKKIAFTADLQPMQINRFDCELHIEKIPQRPILPMEQNATHYIFRNARMTVKINKSTGLLDVYRVDGIDRLQTNAAQLCAFADTADPWYMTDDGFYTKIGTFALCDDKDANAFNGAPDATTPNVRVIENGDVLVRLQAIFRYERSYAVMTYTIPKDDAYVDLDITIYSNNADRMYKLAFPTALQNTTFYGQTAFGTDTLEKEGKEVGYQKWCGLFAANGGFAVLNNGVYGGSCVDDTMYLSLLRTPVYSAHPIGDRSLTDTDRNHARIDMGMRTFSLRLTADIGCIDARAEIFSQPPYALSFFPSGSGEAPTLRFAIDDPELVVTRFGKESGGYMARIYNPTAQSKHTILRLCGTEHPVTLVPFTFETYHLTR